MRPRALAREISAMLTLLLICTGAVSAKSTTSLEDLVQRLRSIPVAESPPTVEVTPNTGSDITKLKHALRDLLVRVMRAPEAHLLEPTGIRARVIDELHRQGLPVGLEDMWDGFGSIQEIEIERPRENPSWLVATTRLSLPCGGNDSSLYLFEERGGHWALVLQCEENGYSLISDAHGWLGYDVAPLAHGSAPFLVVSWAASKCAGCWNVRSFEVLRPGPTPAHPIVMGSGSAHLYECDYEPYLFALGSGRIALIYRGDTTHDDRAGCASVKFTEGVVVGDRVSFRKPVDVDPDFWLDDWRQLDWHAAAQLVEPRVRESARAWHARLRDAEASCDKVETRLVRSAGDGNARLQCVVGCSGLKPPLPGTVYLVLEPRSSGFQLASVGTARPELPSYEGETVYLGGRPGLTDPTLIPESRTLPILSSDARAAGIRTEVRLALVVGEDGRVRILGLLDPSQLTHGIGLAAIDAVKSWRFQPGTKDGSPVPMYTTVEVDVGP